MTAELVIPPVSPENDQLHDHADAVILKFPDVERPASYEDESVSRLGGLAIVSNVTDIRDAMTAPTSTHPEWNLAHDRYTHIAFTEASRPDLASEAWRVHAEGYFSMDFVKPEALTSEGYLADDIDKARGERVDYFIASNPEGKPDSASIRIVNLLPGQSYQDLPGYQLCKDSISPLGEAQLDVLQKTGTEIKEISAMARTAHAHPMAVHELIRRLIREERTSDQAWLFSIVF